MKDLVWLVNTAQHEEKPIAPLHHTSAVLRVLAPWCNCQHPRLWLMGSPVRLRQAPFRSE